MKFVLQWVSSMSRPRGHCYLSTYRYISKNSGDQMNALNFNNLSNLLKLNQNEIGKFLPFFGK